tara:strand:- start:526 stop:771 length:246 start_codon:yes stop_codon:yes gene_type:complete
MQNPNNFINDVTKKQLNGMLEDKEKMLIEFKYLIKDEIDAFNEHLVDEDIESYENGLLVGRHEFAEMLFKKFQELEVKYNV